MTYPLIGTIRDEEMAHLLRFPVCSEITRPIDEGFYRHVADTFDQFVTYKNTGEDIPYNSIGDLGNEEIGIIEGYSIAGRSWYILTISDGVIYSDEITMNRLERAARYASSRREIEAGIAYLAGAALQYLLPLRGYVFAHGSYYVIGGRTTLYLPEAQRGGLYMSTSMRGLLTGMQQESKSQKILRLFTTAVIDGVDDNGEIRYRTIGRTDRMNYLTLRESGNVSYLPIKPGDTPDNPWARAGRQETRPGRFIRSFFTPEDLAREDVTDKDIELFATTFAADSATPDGIEIIRGEEIKRAYSERNYSRTVNIGDMGSSCMRYAQCQSYFGIYTENPNQVAMCVIKDTEGKYVARTILWTDENGDRWHDRIYATAVVGRQMSSWLEDQGIMDARNSGRRIVVRLEKPWHRQYPYLDTMHYIHEDGTLSNRYSSTIPYEPLTSTGGGPSLLARVCKRCERVLFSHRCQDGLCSDCTAQMRQELLRTIQMPRHRVTQIRDTDMTWLRNQRGIIIGQSETLAGATIVAVNGTFYTNDTTTRTWNRLTAKEAAKLYALQRKADRARAKLLATCVTDRTLIHQKIAQGIFPGSFDVTAHLREGTHWGWVDAPRDLIYLCEGDGATKRIIVRVVPQPTIPWGYALVFIRNEKLLNGTWVETKRRRLSRTPVTV